MPPPLPSPAPRVLGLLDRVRLTPAQVRGLGVLALGLAAALPWIAAGWGAFVVQAPEGAEPKQLRPELVVLPGGTFLMGSPVGEVGRQEDEVQHTMTVGSFAMCRTEVTQGQWEAVMGSNPSDCAYGCGPTLPVQNMSWEVALEYLNALSLKEVLSPCYSRSEDGMIWNQACTGYRLPTEAEWEYAARAGTTTAWSWGDSEDGAKAHAWYGTSAGKKVHPVGMATGPIQSNPWGLYDVHGNVWEWVWDWYGDYDVNKPVDNGGATSGHVRVLRGGSFDSPTAHLRSALRLKYLSTDPHRLFGFRCARGAHPILDPLHP